MRGLIAMAAAVLLACPAVAQQARPPTPKGPAQAQQKAPQPPPPPPIFPCRTPEEVCFLGIVTSAKEILVAFTNAPQAEAIDGEPIPVLTGDSAGATLIDLAPHLGRVVMLTGTYEREAGLTKAELVEVASPLVSLSIKAQLAGEEEPRAPPQRGKPQPQRPR